ncbi:MAG TPA: hypothetical protein VMW38_14205 [Terriglobia bacterium]|nr:hypothetical protein [Terriglobia bacterium]
MVQIQLELIEQAIGRNNGASRNEGVEVDWNAKRRSNGRILGGKFASNDTPTSLPRLLIPLAVPL